MSFGLKAIGIRMQEEPMSQLRVKGRKRAVSQLRDSWAGGISTHSHEGWFFSSVQTFH